MAAAARRVRLLGGEVDLVTPAGMLERLAAMVGAGAGGVIANHNAHSLYLIGADPALRAFYASADLIQVDSVPLIAWGALLGLPLRRANRSTYLDWRADFWALAQARRWRVYYLGGAPGVAALACERLARAWPSVNLSCRDGYFDAQGDENREVLGAIAAFAPHILLVGMGMPRQERWIAANRAALGAIVALPVGAAFDYEAGAQPTPPRWSAAIGLEWLFRLAADPRRLARRYLVEPWFLLPRAGADIAAAVGRRGP